MKPLTAIEITAHWVALSRLLYSTPCKVQGLRIVRVMDLLYSLQQEARHVLMSAPQAYIMARNIGRRRPNIKELYEYAAEEIAAELDDMTAAKLRVYTREAVRSYHPLTGIRDE